MTFITEIKKSAPKFIWKHKRPWIAKAILNNNNNNKKHFKLHYRGIAIKNCIVLAQKQYEDQWDRIEDPDMNPCSYTHLIFDKGDKNICWRKDNKCCQKNCISACRKLKLDPCLLLCTSTNSKWIKDLNIRPETLKLVQERGGNTL
jgi:hypothetical protein